MKDETDTRKMRTGMEESEEGKESAWVRWLGRTRSTLCSLGNSDYLEKRKPTRPSVCPWNCQRERKVWAETFQRETQLQEPKAHLTRYILCRQLDRRKVRR